MNLYNPFANVCACKLQRAFKPCDLLLCRCLLSDAICQFAKVLHVAAVMCMVVAPCECSTMVALWMCGFKDTVCVRVQNCGQDIHHATCDVTTELVSLEFCRLVDSPAFVDFVCHHLATRFICKMGVAPMNSGHGNKLVTDL